MSQEQIAANIKARKDAEEVIALIESQPVNVRFWEELKRLVESRLPNPITCPMRGPTPQMNQLRAIAFEKQAIHFGQYAGIEIGCIDCDYLEWLAEGDDFTKRLREYVKSDRYKRRREQE